MKSDQLDLWEAEIGVQPWRGQTPRALTRIGRGLFSRREPLKDDRFLVDENQIALFPVANRRPRRYDGAPLLVELK